MLYNPKWEIEIKADPFSLENLINWIEQQPADKSHDFYCAGECLLGQWVQSMDPSTSIDHSSDSFGYFVNGLAVDLGHFERIANGGGSWTFGAALERARKLAAQA